MFRPKNGHPEALKVELEDGGRIKTYSLRYNPEGQNAARPLPGRSGRSIYTGLDVLAESDFALLREKRFALLTNSTGLNRALEPGIDLFLANGIRPEILFEPEHGIFAAEDAAGSEGVRTDSRTGLRIFSLYSSQKKPPSSLLLGLDYLVVDIQNLPVRCYTYITTLSYLLEAAAEAGTPVLILDRPNPFGFIRARGPYPREELRSFVGYAPVPFLYSMTVGEYGHFVAHELLPNLKLSVIRVQGYVRADADAAASNSWINPSPNIPSFESALVYAGVVFFEGTNVSLGRGTTRPFIYVGAPWMHGPELATAMRSLKLPGVQFSNVAFTPSSSLYTGVHCYGVQIHPTSLDFDPIRTGYELMRAVYRLHPGKLTFVWSGNSYGTDRLWGSDSFRMGVINNWDYETFEKTWIRDSESFEEWIAAYRLY
ncbi:MAG TPA: DUF1343 domain-containing protein [Leptospiraceae bacterium]|nr:DUF1343 domain-containing protein [Leptospiraceae bacterium]